MLIIGMIVMWWREQRKWLELEEILAFICFVAKTTELTILSFEDLDDKF